MASGKEWHKTFYTYIWVFNTGRGLSVCIRLPHNVGIVYDLGCGDDFSPANFICEKIAPRFAKYGKCRIAQCVISHPHADHFSEIDAFSNSESCLYPYLLTCPNDKGSDDAVDFDRLETKDNAELLKKYRNSYKERNLPLQTICSDIVDCPVPNVEYGIYYVRPSQVSDIHENDDHMYGNGLSIVLYLRHGHQSLLIPGDITPESMSELLKDSENVEKRYTYFSNAPHGIPEDFHMATSTQPALSDLLCKRGLSILVAPHHGLASCYSDELFKAMKNGKPLLNIISEKRHLSDSDGKVDPRYQSEKGASGLKVDVDGQVENRYSVSTRDGHHILVVFRGTDGAPHVYLRSNPEDLLTIV